MKNGKKQVFGCHGVRLSASPLGTSGFSKTRQVCFYILVPMWDHLFEKVLPFVFVCVCVSSSYQWVHLYVPWINNELIVPKNVMLIYRYEDIVPNHTCYKKHKYLIDRIMHAGAESQKALLCLNRLTQNWSHQNQSKKLVIFIYDGVCWSHAPKTLFHKISCDHWSALWSIGFICETNRQQRATLRYRHIKRVWTSPC